MRRILSSPKRHITVSFVISKCLFFCRSETLRRLASPAQSLRQFSRSNIEQARIQRQWRPWNSGRLNHGEKKPWTVEELASMKEPSPLFFGTTVPFSRSKAHSSPFPTDHHKRARRRMITGINAIVLITLASFSYLEYSDDLSVFKPPKFTPFVVVGKEQVSPTSFIITLRPEPYILNPKLAIADPYVKEWEEGTWSVEFKQPQLQIARSYTPLPPRKDDPPGDLRFLIREEANGEMSRYVARLAVGDKLEMRGPHMEVHLPIDVTDVVFLAGGTGIAPALQVAYTLLEARKFIDDVPIIHIAWANRRREDCVGGTDIALKDATDIKEGSIVKELRGLQSKFPNKFKVYYYVDEEAKFVDQKTVWQLMQKPSSLNNREISRSTGSKLLFVSGPEGFVNFFAGPKIHRDGREIQGNLGGVLGKMGIHGWKVWKQ